MAGREREGHGRHSARAGTAFGDIALVPGPFLKRPRGIRDISQWYMATAAEPDYVHAVFEQQCEYALKNLETLIAMFRAIKDSAK